MFLNIIPFFQAVIFEVLVPHIPESSSSRCRLLRQPLLPLSRAPSPDGFALAGADLPGDHASLGLGHRSQGMSPGPRECLPAPGNVSRRRAGASPDGGTPQPPGGSEAGPGRGRVPTGDRGHTPRGVCWGPGRTLRGPSAPWGTAGPGRGGSLREVPAAPRAAPGVRPRRGYGTGATWRRRGDPGAGESRAARRTGARARQAAAGGGARGAAGSPGRGAGGPVSARGPERQEGARRAARRAMWSRRLGACSSRRRRRCCRGCRRAEGHGARLRRVAAGSSSSSSARRSDSGAQPAP